MGRMYGVAINIDDKNLYELIKKSSFVERHQKKDGSYTDPEQYIDYAYFLGIRKTLSKTPDDIKLTNEEYDKIQNVTKYKRVRCGYIEFSHWNQKTNEARVCFMGWNETPDGIIEYISKLKPYKEFKIEVSWDVEDPYDIDTKKYYWIENGRITRDYLYTYDSERDVMKEIKKFYRKDGSLRKQVTIYEQEKVGDLWE